MNKEKDIKINSVTAIVRRINVILKESCNFYKDNYTGYIAGEISGMKIHNGNFYFTLKDEHSALSCIMFKSTAAAVPFVPHDGLSVIVTGHLDIYEPRGSLSLHVKDMRPRGIGNLYLELERRKQFLQSQGYFDTGHKKPMPAVIGKIGLVTSETGSVLHDAMETIRNRWPMMEVHLFPAAVQGDRAPAEIVNALQKADNAGLDAILLMRGGGSFEDLFCFNDENIVKTLYNMKTYTVTGIGHETDTSLADLAADHRALTPTAAAQWVTKDQKQMKDYLYQLNNLLTGRMQNKFDQTAARYMNILRNPYLADPLQWAQSRKTRLAQLDSALRFQADKTMRQARYRYDQSSAQLLGVMNFRLQKENQQLLYLNSRLYAATPQAAIEKNKVRVEMLETMMKNRISQKVAQDKNLLAHLNQLLNALSVENTLERGYSVVMQEGHIISSPQNLTENSRISLVFAKGAAKAYVTDISGDESFNALQQISDLMENR
jgi:exodeoxyribonuclease VII large subunit